MEQAAGLWFLLVPTLRLGTPWRAKLCFGGGTPRVGGRAHRATELRGQGRAQTEFGHERAKNAALLDLGSTLVPSVGFGVPPKRTLTGAAQRRRSSALAGTLREVRLGGTPRPTPGTGVLPGTRRAAASREREICGLDAPTLRTRRAQADAGRTTVVSACGEAGPASGESAHRERLRGGFTERSGWMEAATQQDQIAQALRADSWEGRDGWDERLAPNGAARPKR